MTLEDFFTLTEMKDGLTAPARVMELVNVMQKEKDSIIKNVGDATRQWSTVASTITATKDKECLDLFIQLDGLWFLDRWIKDAQKFINNASGSFVEESIAALLHALEKLHIDYERSISCGIWMTVKNLLGHSCSQVQDRAKALFDNWKQDGDTDAALQDIEKAGASNIDGIKGNAVLAGDGGHSSCSAGDTFLFGEGTDEGKHVKPATDEVRQLICADVCQPERIVDVQTQTSEKEKTVDHEVMKDECSSGRVDSPIMVQAVEEIHPIRGKSPVSHTEGSGSIETCPSMALSQGIEGKSDVSKLNEYTEEAMQMRKVSSFPNKSGTVGSVSGAVEPRSLLSGDAANSRESVTEPDLQHNIDIKDEDHLKDSSICDSKEVFLEGKSEISDAGSPHHCRNMVMFQDQGYNCNTNVSLDYSGNKDKLRRPEDPDTSFSIAHSGAIGGVKEHASVKIEDLANDPNFLKPSKVEKDPSVVNKRRSDLELDYSMVDAIEVARQVAIEVEREVVDRREPSCSSSEKISEGGSRQPGSPESMHGKDIQSIEAASKEVPTGPNLSAEALPKGEELSCSVKDVDAETENCLQDMESSQVTEAAQEPEFNVEKGRGDFDLNQEVCSEDVEYPVNQISALISVVSASRAAAAPGLPVAPLQFEGAHGWKGSAATSAFRPASPRRTFEGDQTIVIRESHNSSKQRQDCLDIDLNVSEAADDKIADLIPGKQILVSPGLPSGESSVEASPRRSERLELDLNRISDDGVAPSDWRMGGRVFQQRNGHHSPSCSSSSSSMQPALRNIDLNDQPSSCNDSSNLQPHLGESSSQHFNAYVGLKSDDSVISIMGTRVEVHRKDFVGPTPSLQNCRLLGPAFDVNLTRSGGVLGMGSTVPYAHPPVFGYNGITTGSTFSSSMYGPGGPITYMVDSRGAPVVPQIMGSASAHPAAHSRPPFVVSMIGTPPGSNGVAPPGAGPLRPNFDLNSGLIIDGGNRDSGGLRQLFNSGPSRLMDEPLMRANPQTSSGSYGVGKRKEPDSGWESYPLSYKHQQPPWR